MIRFSKLPVFLLAFSTLYSCNSKNQPTENPVSVSIPTELENNIAADTVAEVVVPDPEVIEAEQYMISPRLAGQVRINMSSDSLKALIPAENLKPVQNTLEGVPYTVYEIRNSQKGDQLLLLAEESCANQVCTIFRIRVLSPKFKTDKGIRVGSTFAEVKNAYPLSFVGIGETDFVAVSDENKMTFTLDISRFPPKQLAKIKQEEIPDSTQVTSIMLF